MDCVVERVIIIDVIHLLEKAYESPARSNAQPAERSIDLGVDRWNWHLFVIADKSTRKLPNFFMFHQLYLVVILRFAEECGQSVLS